MYHINYRLNNWILSLLILLHVTDTAFAHGLMSDPRQRGGLRLDNHPLPILDYDAPQDFEAHFPSGSKSKDPGAGFESVKKAADYNWTPYEPLNPSFHWRAGVCGDEIDAPQDHLMGGKFYYGGKRVREYEQGSIVHFEAEIVTHHNGFFEFFVCNLDTCGGDISQKCFLEGHCHQLRRVYGPCESRFHQGCSPIDPAYPGRWYLPCVISEPMIVGGGYGSMTYVLPPHLACDHCVIQWYWTSANTCNPPGVRDYFTSDRAPQWNDCPGQGGAVNGWTDKGPCGGPQFPEEYWQCADVRIISNRDSDDLNQSPSPSVTPSAPEMFLQSPSGSPVPSEPDIMQTMLADSEPSFMPEDPHPSSTDFARLPSPSPSAFAVESPSLMSMEPSITPSPSPYVPPPSPSPPENQQFDEPQPGIITLSNPFSSSAGLSSGAGSSAGHHPQFMSMPVNSGDSGTGTGRGRENRFRNHIGGALGI